LNRPAACIMRRNTVKLLITASPDDELADIGDRYLIAVCRPSK
jgi:hypothetical protein